MSKWVPLHLHTHYSLLDGLSKPKQVAKRCKDLGYKSCAITDHGTVSGAVSFVKSMRENDIKPILGCEFYLSEKSATIKDKENRTLSHLVVLAKNKVGWERLIEATSRSNDEELFYFKPRLDLDILSEYCDGNLIAFSGHMGSDLANILFHDWKKAYNSQSENEVKQHLKDNYLEEAKILSNKYQEIFGDGNFYIEIQLIDQENSPAARVIGDCLREVSRETRIPAVATADSHYPTKEDAVDQRLLLCAALKTTLKNVKKKLSEGQEVGLSSFFRSNNYHIPSEDEMVDLHTEEELRNSLAISETCEEYDILDKPMLPKFNHEGYSSEHDLLTSLCREGWKKLLKNNGKIDDEENLNIYLERIKEELFVIKEANLAGYFLIVRDIVRYARQENWIPGPGRGSAAGCLISYLIGITRVDSIEYGLIFERFYNAGRNTEEHVSLPDIDIDIPADKRDDAIEYIRNKYGQKKVGQMITFGRLQGRSAIKEVLRANDACSYDEMNRITKNLPHEAEVSDQLQEMDSSSVIMWTLVNQPDSLKDWCYLTEDGILDGEYSKLFEQAMRIEGTFKSQGKHAAGVVISSHDLNTVCPMVRQKNSKEKIAGLEMEDLESMGHVKFDILGVSLLDKIMGVRDQLCKLGAFDNEERVMCGNT